MNRSLVIGLVGLAAIVAAIVLVPMLESPEHRDLRRDAEAPATMPEMERGDAGEKASGGGGGARPGGGTAAAGAGPSFDIVRVNPQGDAVIAGRADPGSTVTVLDGDRVVGTVTTDQNGEWVLVPEQPLDPGNRTLSLTAERPGEGKATSEDVVVLVVPERTEGQEQPLAVLVPREGMETRKILQGPSSGSNAPQEGVSLEVVDYDEAGNVRLSGLATPGGEVAVYLDDKLLGKTRADDTGVWDLRPGTTVAPGLYRLRVDELAGNTVASRIELPFSRAAPMTGFSGETYIIVQPGNSLWRIARRVLGQGTMNSVIYQANKDQIRDADLIYPGQVFAVPKTN